MTSPASGFRLKAHSSATWYTEVAGTLGGLLRSEGQGVEYAKATAQDGLGRPNGMFGKPRKRLPFVPMTATQYNYLMSIYGGVDPQSEAYVFADVELEQTRGTPGWRVYEGYLAWPSKPRVIRHGDGNYYYHDVVAEIISLVDITT